MYLCFMAVYIVCMVLQTFVVFIVCCSGCLLDCEWGTCTPLNNAKQIYLQEQIKEPEHANYRLLFDTIKEHVFLNKYRFFVGPEGSLSLKKKSFSFLIFSVDLMPSRLCFEDK